MELDRLYQYLKEQPRDTRWLLRKLGPDYATRIEELRDTGRPVSMTMETVAGARRLMYKADDQIPMFTQAKKKKRRRAKRAAGKLQFE